MRARPPAVEGAPCGRSAASTPPRGRPGRPSRCGSPRRARPRTPTTRTTRTTTKTTTRENVGGAFGRRSRRRDRGATGAVRHARSRSARALIDVSRVVLSLVLCMLSRVAVDVENRELSGLNRRDLSLALVSSAAKCARQVSPNSVSWSRVFSPTLTRHANWRGDAAEPGRSTARVKVGVAV